MKLYLVRHGESETNLTGCYTGWTQVNLTEKGQKDAEGVRPFLARKSFDKIYSSDLIRAIHTAKIAIPGCEPETTPLIREINLGQLEGKKIADCPEIFGEDFLEHKKVQNFVPYGGESRQMLDERVGKFLDMVANSGHECVAAFAHGGFLRAVVRCVLGEETKTANVRCPNCTVSVWDFDGKRWRLDSWLSPDTVL